MVMNQPPAGVDAEDEEEESSEKVRVDVSFLKKKSVKQFKQCLKKKIHLCLLPTSFVVNVEERVKAAFEGQKLWPVALMVEKKK